jgi:hypothetical protein
MDAKNIINTLREIAPELEKVGDEEKEFSKTLLSIANKLQAKQDAKVFTNQKQIVPVPPPRFTHNRKFVPRRK